MIKKLFIFISVIVLILLLIAFYWIATPYQAMKEALNFSTKTPITVDTSRWISFIPKEIKNETGFIFYPGGRVDPNAYNPICKDLSEQGYLCIIVPMPLNLAFFGINSATEVQKTHPEIKNWIMIGHSLGGSMAVRFARDSKNNIKALIFLASYSDIDISTTNLKVLSLYGSQDKVLNKSALTDNQKNLPKDVIAIEIPGGNHSYMGWYGQQDGDGTAKITREDQQKFVVNEIIKFINNL